MARDNVTQIIERVRRSLASTVRMEVNTLGASLSAIETTVQLTYAVSKSLRSGAVLSIGAELLRVVAVDELAKTADVLRGWQDSTAEAHDSGDEVLINPRFTRFDIFDALTEEIDSWNPDLFYVTDVQMTTTDETQALELASTYADAIGVMTVRRNWTADQQTSVWPEIEFALQRGSAAAWDATTESGLLIRLTPSVGHRGRSGYANAGNLLVTMARPFDASAITEATDLIADLGIERSQLELVELGIKYRLLMDDEQGRSARNAQDEPRRNEEVPPGAAQSIGQATMQRYDRRRAQEIGKLRSRYPMRFW